jgi:3,4-dihydroxy 2-butanone 4-phosphate synthase/GTP cyclohydrolase II
MIEIYQVIVEKDTKEYNACPLKWDCDNCSKSFCLRTVAIADFPSEYGHFNILGFTNNKDKKDHFMIVKGNVVEGENVLTRIHSSCVTGDVLKSLRCDCGPQLIKSLSMIEKKGGGVLLYMQQEGRGIGLTNKIKAYMLQDLGLDTYDSNINLGFKPDERDYEIAAAMLKKLKVKTIQLLTNNPEKIADLKRFDVKVIERIPLEVNVNKYNYKYLQTKKNRFGHILSLDFKTEGKNELNNNKKRK